MRDLGLFNTNNTLNTNGDHLNHALGLNRCDFGLTAAAFDGLSCESLFVPDILEVIE